MGLEGVTILVIEDHDAARKALCAIVSSFGATAVGAGNGNDALTAAAAKKPDLILCDLRMPGIDGFEFLRRLRADPAISHTPVIAMSGLGGEDDLERISSGGFDGHLVKPLDSETIGTLLARFGGGA